MERATIGFRAHSGWACAVALGGSAGGPRLLDRRRIVTADPAIPGSKQPFHAAEGLPLGKAKTLIDRCAASSRELSRLALEKMIAELRKHGYSPAGGAILLASGGPLPPLERVLASHARIHAAEGELFRDVLRRAADECELPLTSVVERGIAARASEALRLPRERWLAALAEMGAAAGPPWRQDEKLAATAAWIALSGPPRQRGRSNSESGIAGSTSIRSKTIS